MEFERLANNNYNKRGPEEENVFFATLFLGTLVITQTF